MKKVVLLYSIVFLSGLFSLFSCQWQVKKEIYLQLYSVRDDINADYVGTIAKVADMGFTGVEVVGYDDGKFYDMMPGDFKKSIEEIGMEVLSSHVEKPLSEPVADTNWDEIWSWWSAAIQAHKDAGMKYLIVPSIPAPNTLEDLQAYCDYFNQIGEMCQDAGLGFGYHNHQFEFSEVEGKMILKTAAR